MLAGSLIRRMRLDLTAPLEDDEPGMVPDENGRPTLQDAPIHGSQRRWMALPRTLRLSTRPRPPLNPDGSRSRTFTRISKSASMPSFVFSLTIHVDELVEKLLEESLLPLFKKLHPEKSGWNLSLVNVCATSMSLSASDGKDGAGRDIGRMFKRQIDVLKDWKVDDVDTTSLDEEADEASLREDSLYYNEHRDNVHVNVENAPLDSESTARLDRENSEDNGAWDSEDMQDVGVSCTICGAIMPPWAMEAHERFHTMPD